MTAEALSVKAEIRSISGKGVARGLRRLNRIPAVIYSKGKDSVMVSIFNKDIKHLQNNNSFSSTLVELDLDGAKYNLLAKSMSYHPVTDELEHIEFMDVGSKASKVTAQIPVKIEGKSKSAGVKRDGVINLVMRYLDCIVNNDNIPSYIPVDVSTINIGDVLRLRDIALPESVTFKYKDLDRVILKISGKKAAKDAVSETQDAPAAAAADKK